MQGDNLDTYLTPVIGSVTKEGLLSLADKFLENFIG
jgi:hypothetical protein